MIEKVNAIVLTSFHAVAGDVSTRGKRLSDFLNDPNESVIRLDHATIARLDSRDEVLERASMTIVPKQLALVLVDSGTAPGGVRRLYSYTQKETHEVFLVADRLEVRGQIHVAHADAIDFHRLLSTYEGSFLPVTNATLKVGGNPGQEIEQATLLVNIRHIEAIGKV